MTKTNTDKPAFFQQFDDLIQLIPKQTHSTATHSLINNYLDHYALNLDAKDHCARHEIWQSNINNFRIVEQCWQPLKPNGKQIVLCHGYFDHTALYGKIIRWALAQGYSLHSFDLPGHGLSSGERASIDSFDQYSRILLKILHRENYQHTLCVGQSTGCSIIINALLNPSFNIDKKASPKKIILLAPLVRSIHWQHLRWLYLLLNSLLSSIKRGFVSSSHDKKFNHFLHYKDPLQSHKLPLKWLGAMDEWVHVIQEFKSNFDYPCRIIQGTGDNTVDYHYNLPQIKRCLPNTKYFYIDGAYHHLVNESTPYWEEVKRILDLQQA